MPDITKFNDEKEWMGACVPAMMDEGKPNDQAVAACMTMWSERKSLKVGARNSAADQGRVQQMHDMAHEMHDMAVSNGATCDAGAMQKAVDDGDLLVNFGDEIKSLDSGRSGGYLVRFSDDKSPDLADDFFTKETDFGFTGTIKTPVWFHHRQPLPTKDGRYITVKEQIGEGTLSIDEIGILIEAIDYNRAEYERAISSRNVKMGWSSGTAPHLVDRVKVGKAFWIKRWPLGFDASKTPTPAEPHNGVVELKSLTNQPLDLSENPETAQENRSDSSAAKAAESKQPTRQEAIGETEMSKEEMDELKVLLTAQGEQIKTYGEKVNALETVIKTVPPVSTVPAVKVEIVSDPADRKFENAAEQCRAIKAAVKSQGRQYDPRLSRLDAIKAVQGSSEGIPEDGGYLLEPTVSPELLKPVHDFGMFSSAARPMPVLSTSNSGWINGVNETDMSAGLVWGGVIAYRVAEGATITVSKPKFRRLNWQLKKYAALVYDTDELLQDAGQFQAVANQACNESIVFLQNDDIVRGDGAAGCWGILSNGSLVSVTKETNQAADSVLSKNLSKMWQRLLPQSRSNATWFINSEVEPELDELSIPAGTAALEPRFVTYGTDSVMRIKGRPVVVTPFNSALGDKGDIILADMSAYLMWTKGGIQTAQSIHVEFLTDQNVFRFIARADGQPVLASAITPYKGASTQSNFVTLDERA